MGQYCNESDWYNFNNIKNNFYYLICKYYIVKFIVCISNTTQQYIWQRERERERVVYTSIAFTFSIGTFWISWTWIKIELLFGGCEIETMTEVVEFASCNGRWSVLVDEIHEFGAIMKKKWLHTASSRLNVVMDSPSCKCYKRRLPLDRKSVV